MSPEGDGTGQLSCGLLQSVPFSHSSELRCHWGFFGFDGSFVVVLLFFGSEQTHSK